MVDNRSSRSADRSTKGHSFFERSRSPGFRLKKPPFANTTGASSLTAPSVQQNTALRPPTPPEKPGVLHRPRKSWPPNGAARAWYLSSYDQRPYDITPLLNAQRVPELWDEYGDTLVHLFPRQSNCGPSFKIDSSTYSNSDALMRLVHSIHDIDTAAITLAVPTSSPSPEDGFDNGGSSTRIYEAELYLPVAFSGSNSSPNTGAASTPLSSEDEAKLLSVRNFFAFLTGQELVASPIYPSHFSVFMTIADNLEGFNFTNLDGSSFGEVASNNFAHYKNLLQLGDVRYSAQRMAEGIVLGHRMRDLDLYTESFVHAAGKYDDLQGLDQGLQNMIADVVQNRLERGSFDLGTRLSVVKERLSDFDFPSLFSGVAISKESLEGRGIDFKAWKTSFQAIRKHVIGFYKDAFGAWPPKASSKKNHFEESGLNRLVLKRLYEDFCDLYDVFVDRKSFNPRAVAAPTNEEDDESSPSPEGSLSRALRSVMSEYDRSSPPVLPPIPFDIPQQPSAFPHGQGHQGNGVTPNSTDRSRKLRDDEIEKVLLYSRNGDASKTTPFLNSFRQFEKKHAHGKTLAELCDQRSGYWMFLYAVLQTLPLVVMDAPGVEHTDGVEYFLCIPPKGGAPWLREESRRMSWYGIAGGAGGIVNLPSDVVDHGIEGIYRRSHCWVSAEKWSGNIDMSSINHALPSAAVPPNGSPHLTSSSPGRGRSTGRNSISLNPGLDALPVPSNVDPTSMLGAPNSLPPTPDPNGTGSRSSSRPASRHDPTKRFEDIIPQTHIKKKRSSRLLGGS